MVLTRWLFLVAVRLIKLGVTKKLSVRLIEGLLV